MNGFLNLNKPFGLTSHDCVARVRKLLRLKRVGHGGTLDPAATGVLPIAIGKATRLLQYLSHEKAYRATIRFGVKTTTDDLEGDVLTANPVPWLTLANVQPQLSQFEGTIQQIPPSYSAIQIGGKRLYALARAGEAIEAPVRTVEIYRIEVLDWRSGSFPELDVAIACGTGTYIRSIARDLGDALETGGTLAALTRTHSNGFKLENSLTLEIFAEQLQSATFQQIAPDIPLQHLTTITLSTEPAKRWCQGQRLVNQANESSADSIARIYHENGQFLGIGRSVVSQGEWVLLPKLVWE
ncbi:MAG: tRNA pseudouridine(55) synthase TruB [Cyanobacteria bacterium CRU_2_1]|nr:tRNA pseudouridine(55) synthase TruB [Cyanobacteria bacterium RU_5_0]NJR63842.1 tRNA pseudouridine(55) synthase TruB [Cyanobacteria bacterium CRU_2_1]